MWRKYYPVTPFTLPGERQHRNWRNQLTSPCTKVTGTPCPTTFPLAEPGGMKVTESVHLQSIHFHTEPHVSQITIWITSSGQLLQRARPRSAFCPQLKEEVWLSNCRWMTAVAECTERLGLSNSSFRRFGSDFVAVEILPEPWTVFWKIMSWIWIEIEHSYTFNNKMS